MTDEQIGGRECCQEARGDQKRVIAYIRDVLGGETHVWIESTILKYSLASLVVLSILAIISNSIWLDPALKATGFPSILFLTIGTSVMVVASASHMSSYRKNMSCQNGMMIGMTSGMMSGFLFGAFVGATNGMFLGSVGGTLVGILVGLILGRYSGIMGAMEGVMSGLMAGTMGAMLSVMMISDHLMIFLVLLSGISIIIFGGLSYMMHREAGSISKAEDKPDLLIFFLTSSALAGITAVLMLFGPRGPITI